MQVYASLFNLLSKLSSKQLYHLLVISLVLVSFVLLTIVLVLIFHSSFYDLGLEETSFKGRFSTHPPPINSPQIEPFPKELYIREWHFLYGPEPGGMRETERLSWLLKPESGVTVTVGTAEIGTSQMTPFVFGTGVPADNVNHGSSSPI